MDCFLYGRDLRHERLIKWISKKCEMNNNYTTIRWHIFNLYDLLSYLIGNNNYDVLKKSGRI